MSFVKELLFYYFLVLETVKMTMDLEKGTVHCLLCSNKVGSSIRSSLNIFEDKSVANPEKPLVDILSPIVKSQLEKDVVHSSVICKKCCKLVNEVCYYINCCYYEYFQGTT